MKVRGLEELSLRRLLDIGEEEWQWYRAGAESGFTHSHTHTHTDTHTCTSTYTHTLKVSVGLPIAGLVLTSLVAFLFFPFVDLGIERVLPFLWEKT